MASRVGVPLLLLGIAVLFLVANRGAYKNYFQEDDLDTLSWTPHVAPAEYVIGLVSPRLSPYNVRPVGHGFYGLMEATAGLHFGWWAAAIQTFHLFNVFLLWKLLRSLSFDVLPATAGLIFFVVHPATFSAYWQPQSIFDLLCSTFTIACILLYRYRRWVWSLLCLWLAYKSKEIAIMLPLILLAQEYWFGDRRYLRLLPFFAISLLFGLQAIFTARTVPPDYRMSVTVQSLATTVPYYLGQMFRSVIAGFAMLLLVPALVRDRRAWFGVAAAVALFVPLLFLPRRLMPVYCYLPSAFVGIEIAAIAAYSSLTRIAVPAVMLLLWMPVTYIAMRHYRSGLLYAAEDNRILVNTLSAYIRAHPDVKSFLLDNRPSGTQHWGVTGAVHYLNQAPDVHTGFVGSPEGADVSKDPKLAVMSWDGGPRRLDVFTRDPQHPFVPYVDVGRGTAIWQLEHGWLGRDGGFRLIEPVATAILDRPMGVQRFEVRANIDARGSKKQQTGRLTVLINGAEIGTHVFAEEGWQTIAWNVPAGTPGIAKVEFRTDAPFSVGIAAFGFKTP